MSQLAEAVKQLDAFLKSRGWQYCLVGGIAVQHWGEPRATKDVDICLLTGLGNERSYIDEILLHFSPRFDKAAEFAEERRVLLIQAANGVGIDVALGWMPFEEKMLCRATPFKLAEGVVVPTASAEDLIATKAFADRGLDWVDVERILARQRGKLDWQYRGFFASTRKRTHSPSSMRSAALGFRSAR